MPTRSGQSEEHAATTAKPFVVEADPRGRVSLARAGRLAERYLCYALGDGRIILQPAVVVSELELTLLGDPGAVARLDEGRAELAAGAVGGRGWTRIEADQTVDPPAGENTGRIDT